MKNNLKNNERQDFSFIKIIELLNHLQEHEAEFQEKDYKYLLNSIYRSNLKNIFKELGNNYK